MLSGVYSRPSLFLIVAWVYRNFPFLFGLDFMLEPEIEMV